MGKTRVLTESAVILAIYIILLLITLYVPILSYITLFILSLPFVIFAAKRGLKNGVFLFAAAVILTILFGSFISIPVTILFGTSGIIIGYLYKKGKTRYEILAVGSIVFLVNFLLLYGVLVVFMDINPLEEFNKTAELSIQTSKVFMAGIGQTLNEKQLDQLEEALELAPLLIPTVLVFLSVFLAFITQVISTPILKRLKFKTEKWPPFREIKLPRSIIWYYLIVMILMMSQVVDKESILYIGIINLFFVLELLMVVQGLSFIFFFSYHKKLANGIPITILILSLFLPFLLYIVRIIGIIDLGFNIREEVR